MIKRVSVFCDAIFIEEGPVRQHRPGEGYKNLQPNTQGEKFLYALSTETFVPEQTLSFMSASKVLISTLEEDEEQGEFYDLRQQVLSDRIYSVRIRQFITAPVIGIDKQIRPTSFVKLDIEF